MGAPSGGRRYFSPYGNPRLPDGPPGEHLPARLAAETAAFISAHRDQPFLAYLSFYSVHIPLMARDDLRAKYEAKIRTVPAAAARFGHEGANKVRLGAGSSRSTPPWSKPWIRPSASSSRKLEELKPRRPHDRDLHVGQRRSVDGRGNADVERAAACRQRLALRRRHSRAHDHPRPGLTKPGSECDTPVISTDFYPTILDLTALPPRPAQHLDGQSLVPLLRGQALARGPLFWHYPHYGNQGGSPAGAIRVGDWKLIEWYEDGRHELFNLHEDVGERRNRAGENPAKVQELAAQLDAWRKSVGAKMPTPNGRK